MIYLKLAIYVLALWRVSSLVTSERGPFDIFLKLRKRFGVEHDDFGQVEAIPTDKSMPYLLTCMWCCSMLLALPYVVLIYFFQDMMAVLSFPFALSALAIAFDGVVRK